MAQAARLFRVCLLVVAALACSGARGSAPADEAAFARWVAGTWQGTFPLSGQDVRFTFSDGSYRVWLAPNPAASDGWGEPGESGSYVVVTGHYSNSGDPYIGVRPSSGTFSGAIIAGDGLDLDVIIGKPMFTLHRR